MQGDTVQPPFSVAILHGGKARRMGGIDKGGLVVDGVSIRKRTIELAAGLSASVAVVGAPPAIRDEIDRGAQRVELLADAHGGSGPMDGLLSALRWSPDDWVLLLPCDMPFLARSTVEVLASRRDEGLVAVAAEIDGRLQPLQALYHKSALIQIEERVQEGKLSLRDFLRDGSADRSVCVLPEEAFRGDSEAIRSFANWNRPQDVSQSASEIE